MVYYANVFINMNLMASSTDGQRQGNFAHEFGHGIAWPILGVSGLTLDRFEARVREAQTPTGP